MPLTKEKKAEFVVRIEHLLDTYNKVMVIGVDNVGSNQLQQARIAIRGEAVILMGKNTLTRKVIKMFLKKHPGHPIELLLPKVAGNVGLVFTNGDLGKVREKLEANRVPAPARVGAECPVDVVVPPGPTGCDPGQTSFFQTLNISTKLVKGQIEILNPVNLLKKGDKVGNSEAALLQKLNIRPFTYGITIQTIYDNGSLYDAAVLDLTTEELTKRFVRAIRNLAAASLSLGFPTVASVPHSVVNAYKTVLAVAIQLDSFTFPKADEFKAFLANPGAFASAAPSSAAAAPAPVVEAPKKAESEVDLGGMSMFGAPAAAGGSY